MKRNIITTILLLLTVVLAGQIKVEPPVLVSPSNGATNQMPDVVLDWNAVIGAKSYELQLSLNSGFTNIVLDSITDLTAIKTRYLKFGQQYHWRVRSLYEGNIVSDWSTVRNFTVFAQFDLFRPLDNATKQAPNVELQWRDRVGPNSITGVTFFEIQLDTVNTFSSPELHTYTVAGNVFKKNAASLFFGKKYFWRARAGHPQAVSNWSSVRSFTVIAAPDLTRPTNNSVNVDLNVNLQWSVIAGIQKYEYYVDTTPAFLTPMVELTTNNVEPAKDLFYGQKYFWRVRARHNRDISGWSAVWNFTTANNPNLIFPANGDTNVSVRPQLRWSQIKGTVKYEINLSKDPNNMLQKILRKDASDLEPPSFNIAPDLDPSTVYYWRVRAYSNVDTSDYSPVWSFKTASPVGINQPEINSELTIYPTPADQELHIRIFSPKPSDQEIFVLDLLGKTVIREQVTLKTGYNELQLNISDLREGVYLLKLSGSDGVLTRKIFIGR